MVTVTGSRSASVIDNVQTGLDVAGLVPGIGEIADGSNALIHLFRGNYLQAGLSTAAMVPFLGWGATGEKLAGKIAISRARIMGELGERAAGIAGSKTRIVVNGRIRVPDAIDGNLSILTEVKNVKSLNYTSQLRDYQAYAQQNGYTFVLRTRPNTHMSGPLRNAINSGDIIWRPF